MKKAYMPDSRSPGEINTMAWDYEEALEDVEHELERATTLYPNPANSAHEAFAVLHEEFDELKAHVWMNQRKRDLIKMREEAIQVAAMAIRFAAEVCGETVGRK